MDLSKRVPMSALDFDSIVAEAIPDSEESFGDSSAIEERCKKCGSPTEDFQITSGYCPRTHIHYTAGTRFCPVCKTRIGISQVESVATSPEGQKFLDQQKAIEDAFTKAADEYHAANPPKARRRRRVRRRKA